MILLDTHATIWLATDSDLLGDDSRAMLERAVLESGLAVSAISFWEIALLIVKGRFASERPVTELRRELLAAGVTELALTGDIALLAVALEDLPADPADRFIVATALAHGATLMTADAALLRWRHALPRQDAAA